jgi:hypothetical protein
MSIFSRPHQHHFQKQGYAEVVVCRCGQQMIIEITEEELRKRLPVGFVRGEVAE